MSAPVQCRIGNNSPLGRRVNGYLSQLRQCRDSGYGVRADIEALFALVGFDPANPTADATAAVAAALDATPDQIAPGLAGFQQLAALDLTGPLARFTSPVG